VRYRRRLFQPLQGKQSNLAATEKRYGRDVTAPQKQTPAATGEIFALSIRQLMPFVEFPLLIVTKRSFEIRALRE
jgi:hypothetical protein